MSIIARAPLRLSFGGGGTDLPAFYERYGGFVVSTSISRHALVVASPAPDHGIGTNSADFRTWLRWPRGVVPDDGEPLSLPRALLGWFAERSLLPHGVDLFLASEVAPGSGLGSSSAMAVAVVKALAEFSGLPLTLSEVATLACQIEIDQLGRPIGKQDHYAAAYGGLNAISFSSDGVAVEPLAMLPGAMDRLEQGLLLFSTGVTRDSASILREQQQRSSDDAATVNRLQDLKALAVDMRTALEAGDLERFGMLIDCGWQIKRGIHHAISSTTIDRVYAIARQAGALGGKVAGAGGGGFLMLYAWPDSHQAITTALIAEGLRPLAFALDRSGVSVATTASSATFVGA